MFLVILFRLTNDILRHDDSSVDENAYGDRDSSQGHDVGRDAEVMHEQKGRQNREGERDGDDQDTSEMPQKNNVSQRHEDDFLDQRRPQCVDRVANE